MLKFIVKQSEGIVNSAQAERRFTEMTAAASPFGIGKAKRKQVVRELITA